MSESKKAKHSRVKTNRSDHLVNHKLWPTAVSVGAYVFCTVIVMCIHDFTGGWWVLQTVWLTIIFVSCLWLSDILSETSYEQKHSAQVRKSLSLCMILFIVFLVSLFFCFFWAFIWANLGSTHFTYGVWTPKSAPKIDTPMLHLLNTLMLLASSTAVTWAYHAFMSGSKKHTVIALMLAIGLGCLFTFLQISKYTNAPLNTTVDVGGSWFYMLTGYFCFCMMMGTMALIVSLVSVMFNNYTKENHFSLVATIWYWHSADVIWFFLFMNFYWWGNEDFLFFSNK